VGALEVVADVRMRVGKLAPMAGDGRLETDKGVTGWARPLIQGHFLTGYDIPQSSGVGPNYGAYVPPRLAL
jgi:hypothetical protein